MEKELPKVDCDVDNVEYEEEGQCDPHERNAPDNGKLPNCLEDRGEKCHKDEREADEEEAGLDGPGLLVVIVAQADKAPVVVLVAQTHLNQCQVTFRQAQE